ncbi:hypothetical protein [Oryza sativa Japonica Group]|uniref:Uncharacterized protein n=1 Tax=Oryza sativa subsp. japonica TaxID=39947 RepID=Q5VPI6_ORYSJ|nr:hypothetical protein [Oryza sativa Japonica Group]
MGAGRTNNPASQPGHRCSYSMVRMEAAIGVVHAHSNVHQQCSTTTRMLMPAMM